MKSSYAKGNKTEHTAIVQIKKGKRFLSSKKIRVYRRSLREWSFYSKPSKIFGSRCEASMRFDKDLMAQMQKSKEIPDKYFGLLNKGSVFKYARRLPKASRLRMTPFSNASDICVFPFLLSEAKSSTSGKSQSEIELQIFFQLRELLLTQNSLATKSDGDCAAFHPLVWAVTYAGDRVHMLAAGLNSRSKDRYCTVVFPHSA